MAITCSLRFDTIYLFAIFGWKFFLLFQLKQILTIYDHIPNNIILAAQSVTCLADSAEVEIFSSTECFMCSYAVHESNSDTDLSSCFLIVIVRNLVEPKKKGLLLLQYLDASSEQHNKCSHFSLALDKLV